MKEAMAKFSFVRTPARKVRAVLDLIRGRNINEAETILKFTRRKAAELVLKLLKSASDNAVKDQHLAENKLFVKECYADSGPSLKRFRPRAFGRASAYKKRYSHISIILGEL